MTNDGMTNDELPEGWAATTLEDIARDVTYGYTAKSNRTSGGAKMLRITDIQDNRVDWSQVPFCAISAPDKAKYLLKKWDLVFARTGATVGKSFLIQDDVSDSVFASYLIRVRCLEQEMTRYLSYFFNSPAYWDQITDFSAGIGQPNVNGSKLKGLSIPLAPLAEQKRIADKLEAVLGRVDACRARLDRVPALLKRFRQSVLAAATSGKLTEEWRNAPPDYAKSFVEYPYSHDVIGPTQWTQSTFGELCDLIGGSQPPKSTFTQEDSPLTVRLIQIRDYKSDKHMVFIPRKLARRFCSKTDVMIGRYGPPIFQILRGLEGAYNVALMKAQPKRSLDLDYLYFWLQQEVLLRYVEAGSDRTAGQDGIRKDLVERYPLFLPPLPEQQEIVRRVEALFAFADRIEARLATAQKTVERLTPSFLAKAFRGKLVPQDPNDEPASALLERLNSQPIPQPARGKRTKRP